MLYICDGATLFDWLGNVFLCRYVQKGRLDRWKNLPSLSNLSILDVTIITSGQGPAFYTQSARFSQVLNDLAECMQQFDRTPGPRQAYDLELGRRVLDRYGISGAWSISNTGRVVGRRESVY